MHYFLVIFLLVSNAFARWATKDDVPYSVLSSQREIKIKKDGSSSVLETATFEILQESAKSYFSLYNISFRSNSSTIQIIEAKVTNGDQTFVVTKDKMVERSLGSQDGIDDSKAIQIVFPGIQVGSKIFLKYLTTNKKASVPEHYSTRVEYSGNNYTLSEIVSFESEIPLFHSKNDPFNILEFSEKKEGDKYFLTYKTLQPYIFHPVKENGVLPLEKTTLLSVSSDQDWTRLSQYFHKEYEAVLNLPLPNELQVVTDSLKQFKSDEEKVNFVVGWITTNFNYVGDWRTITGKYIPRPASQIVSTKYGDCKDFASILTMMLRRAGMKADVSLVHRSSIPDGRILKAGLPGISFFNHAIVRVVNQKGTFWVDPTNPSSASLMHRSDIAGKSALALDGKSILETIPFSAPETNQLVINKNFILGNDKSAIVESKIILKGSSAILFTGLENMVPKEKIKQAILALQSQGEDPVLPEFAPFDLKNKMFKDLTFDVKYSASSMIKQDEKESYVYLPRLDTLIYPYTVFPSQFVGDVFLGEQQQVRRKFVMKGVFAKKRLNNCTINSPWVDFSRTFSYDKDGLIVVDFLNSKQLYILNADFDSSNHQVMRSALSRCGSNSVVWINSENTHDPGVEKLDLHLAKLPVAERIKKRLFILSEAENSNDAFSRDEKEYLFQQNLKDDPMDAQSWFGLASAVAFDGYTTSGNYSSENLKQGLKVIMKGLAQNKNDVGLWLGYIRFLQLTKSEEKAKALLPKVLKIGLPPRLGSYFTLSKVFLGVGDFEKGTRILESARRLAVTPEDKYNYHFNLANAYSSVQNFEKCAENYYEAEKFRKENYNNFIYTNIPYCLNSLKRYDDSIAMARKGLKISQNIVANMLSDSLLARAEQSLNNGKMELAMKDIVDSMIHYKNPLAYQLLAQIELKKNNIDRAFELILEGVAYSKDYLDNYYRESGEYFLRVNIAYYMKLMELSINEAKDPVNKLISYYKYGTGLHVMKKRFELYDKMEEGIKYGLSILQNDKNNWELYSTIAQLYALYGIDADNVELLNKAIHFSSISLRLEPEDGTHAHIVGQCNAVLANIKAGRIPASELDYNLKNRKVVLKDPNKK